MVREGVRGGDQQQNHIFSYLSPEARVRKDHPLRAIRTMVDEVLTQLSRRFDRMYARVGRPSIAPEKPLRRSCFAELKNQIGLWRLRLVCVCAAPQSQVLP
jgi:hypothetical protein